MVAVDVAAAVVFQMNCLCIVDYVRLVDVDSVHLPPFGLESLPEYRLAIVDTTVVPHCIVVLLVAALTVAVTHIEHYYLRSNFQTVEQSNGKRERNVKRIIQVEKRRKIYEIYEIHFVYDPKGNIKKGTLNENKQKKNTNEFIENEVCCM